MDTCTLPGITTAAGFGFSGKFMAKYWVSTSICSFGSVAPTLIIICRLLRQPSSL
jgi:hypothetical protein